MNTFNTKLFVILVILLLVCVVIGISYKSMIPSEKVQVYENLSFDRQKLYNLYQEARASWDTHQLDKDEKGQYMYGNGAAEGFITDYIKEKDPNFEKVLDIIWDYCSTKIEDEGMVVFRNCYIDEIKKAGTE